MKQKLWLTIITGLAYCIDKELCKVSDQEAAKCIKRFYKDNVDQPESSGAQPSAQLRRASGALLAFACASPGIISRYLTSINHLLTITYSTTSRISNP